MPNDQTHLPKIFFCHGCGEIHFHNDISFKADVEGVTYGDTYLNGTTWELERNDDDTHLENVQYYCQSCEIELTDKIEKTTIWMDAVTHYYSLMARIDAVNNGNSDYTPFNENSFRESILKIVSETGKTCNVINMSSRRISLRRVDTNAVFLSFHDSLQNEFFVFVNPMYNAIINLCEFEGELSVTNTEKSSKLQNFFFESLNIALNEELTSISQAEQIQGLIQTILVLNQRVESGTNTRIVEDNPENSPIMLADNHQRFRQNTIESFCECQHCKHIFEIDNTVNDQNYFCPVCKQITEHA